MDCLEFQSLIGILVTVIQWDGVSLQVQWAKFQSLKGIIGCRHLKMTFLPSNFDYREYKTQIFMLSSHTELIET